MLTELFCHFREKHWKCKIKLFNISLVTKAISYICICKKDVFLPFGDFISLWDGCFFLFSFSLYFKDMVPKVCQDKFKEYPVVLFKFLLQQLRNHKAFTGCWLCSRKNEQENIHFYITCNGQTVGKIWLFSSSIILSLTKTCKRGTIYFLILKRKKNN